MFGKKFEKEITVEGMHCGHCAKRAEETIMKIDGVKKVVADFSSGKVKIVSKAEIDDAAVKAAVESLGYSVK